MLAVLNFGPWKKWRHDGGLRASLRGVSRKRIEELAVASALLRTPVVAATQRRLRLRGRNEPFFVLVEVILLTALLATLYLSAINRGTATNYRIGKLQIEQARLERDNADLRLQISQAQSLDRIHTEAMKLGMVPVDAKQVLYLELPPEVSTVRRPAPTAGSR